MTSLKNSLRIVPGSLVTVRSALLVLTAVMAATVAAGGMSVLGYLLATHAFTPRQLQYSIPLAPEIVNESIVADAIVLPLTSGSIRQEAVQQPASAARLLPPGMYIDLYIDLEIPYYRSLDQRGVRSDVAHVTTELRSTNGRLADRAVQTVLLRRSGSMLRTLKSPLRWMGFVEDTQIIPLKVFANYKEQADRPFTALHVAIKSLNHLAPEILNVRSRVRLRLGLIRRLLFYIKPNVLLALVLGSCAVAAAVAGSFVSVAILSVMALAVLRGQPRDGDISDGSLSDGDEALSELLEGAESVDLATPRELAGLEELETDDFREEIKADHIPDEATKLSQPDHADVSLEDTAYGSEPHDVLKHGLRWRGR
jgi:hypothetical protein